MSHALYLIGRACYRARRRVLAAWLLLLIAVGTGLATVGTALDEGFSIPGTPAQDALDDLSRTFPQTATGAGVLVVHAEQGTVTDPATEEVVRRALTEVAGLDGVSAVTDPYTGALVAVPGTAAVTPPPPPEVVRSERVSDDGSTVYAQVQFDDDAQYIPDEVLDDVRQAMDPVRERPSVAVSFGGEAFRETGAHLSVVEVIGVLVALVVLAVTFRSLLAAFLPIGTAIVGVGIATGGLLLLSNVIEVSSSAPTLGMMIGLAVGIDYALFIVSRHRELLGEGHGVEEAVARANATAGSAVVFAGATVIIALAGLSIAQIPFLTVMGLGAAFSVTVAVTIALTLLPALLGFAGDRLRLGKRHAASAGVLAGRWSGLVRRFRHPVTAGAVLLLVACAVPATDLRLALPDNGDEAAGSTQRLAYDTIAAEFGPGYNGPLTVSANILGSTNPLAAIDQIANTLAGTPGVAAVTNAVPNETADTAVFSVVPAEAPDAPATKDLVGDLRDLAEEPGMAGYDLAVTGPTAVSLDVSERLAGALVPFGAVVVGLSLLLLMLVFRSVLVPLTASLGYLLSTAASFGAVAMVFEYGWGAGLIGVDRTGPVISFLPIMLMGVLFGLAMDYQVFLVSRMREHYTHHRARGGTAEEAVDAGIRQSSKVVVAAAVIMIAVFAAFVPTGDAVLKPIAFALAAGVLLDAFVVRLTLIPALMTVMGRWAWWLPARIDRRLPELDVEGATLDDRLADTDGPAVRAGALVRADGVVVDAAGTAHEVDDFALAPGGLVALEGAPAAISELLWAVTGRARPARGRLTVAGRPARRASRRPVVGIGGVAGQPARGRKRTELAAAEPRFAAVAERLRSRSAEFADATGQDADVSAGPPAEVVDNLAWALSSRPAVIAVELPVLATGHAETVWDLLHHIADEGTAVLVATPAADPTDRVRVRPVHDIAPVRAAR
ncbi:MULTISPECIES: MMPL family transporter [Catenuloplanes]|uniref:RND superfamily putative drug exporter n=1 Tax=Catenuloplanes niger TaxID=587534 RepID=A0AAE3ZM18_9ACTN|nr:MMPL family transporter [Catenuloplanes niger]MDR7322399.1 RND superfamily putative drug exporter [Catenuloplanes niger]